MPPFIIFLFLLNSDFFLSMAADVFVVTSASKGVHRSAHRVSILSLIASKIVLDGGVKVLATSCLIRIKAKPLTGDGVTHASKMRVRRQKGVSGKSNEDVIALKVSHHFSLAAQKSGTSDFRHAGLQNLATPTLCIHGSLIPCRLLTAFLFFVLFHKKKRNIARP